MATSGSVDFNPDAQQLVSEAFKLIGVRPAETPLDSFEIQDGLNQLNLMLKGWQSQGLHLWCQEEGVIFLDVGKTDYLLGPSGDEATTLDDFVGTTTTADEPTSETVIAVTDSTGMTAEDYVGVELDAGTRHWTTIVTVDSATQITITAGLPSAAASGSTVFTFTDLIQRPLRVNSSRRKTYGEDNEIEIQSWSRQEYFNQVNKSSQGTVVNAYYSPQLVNGRYYVWQTADSVNKYVRITFDRPIEDVDLESETLDIPVEWLETVVYNLAARLADSYSVPMQKVQSVTAKAAYFLEQAIGWDEEIESIFIQPRLY